MDIGSLLKNKRKELKLSVKYVTEALSKYNINISEKTLYGWENNYRQPDADAFLILCLIYNITDVLSYFADTTHSEEISQSEKELIKKYRVLTDEQKGAVNANINYFIDLNKSKMEQSDSQKLSNNEAV